MFIKVRNTKLDEILFDSEKAVGNTISAMTSLGVLVDLASPNITDRDLLKVEYFVNQLPSLITDVDFRDEVVDDTEYKAITTNIKFEVVDGIVKPITTENNMVPFGSYNLEVCIYVIKNKEKTVAQNIYHFAASISEATNNNRCLNALHRLRAIDSQFGFSCVSFISSIALDADGDLLLEDVVIRKSLSTQEPVESVKSSVTPLPIPSEYIEFLNKIKMEVTDEK